MRFGIGVRQRPLTAQWGFPEIQAFAYRPSPLVVPPQLKELSVSIQYAPYWYLSKQCTQDPDVPVCIPRQSSRRPSSSWLSFCSVGCRTCYLCCTVPTPTG